MTMKSLMWLHWPLTRVVAVSATNLRFSDAGADGCGVSDGAGGGQPFAARRVHQGRRRACTDLHHLNQSLKGNQIRERRTPTAPTV